MSILFLNGCDARATTWPHHPSVGSLPVTLARARVRVNVATRSCYLYKTLVQAQVARHGPMIRRGSPSDCGLRSSQALRKYEVEGGVWKTVSPLIESSTRIQKRFSGLEDNLTTGGAVVRDRRNI